MAWIVEGRGADGMLHRFRPALCHDCYLLNDVSPLLRRRALLFRRCSSLLRRNSPLLIPLFRRCFPLLFNNSGIAIKPLITGNKIANKIQQ